MSSNSQVKATCGTQMKNFCKILLTIFFALAQPLHADTTADAVYIIDQHMIAISAEERFNNFNQSMLANMQSAFADLEVKIVDPERFVSELTGEFSETFLREVREAATMSVLRRLTPNELSQISSFYRSERGQVLIEGGIMTPFPNDSFDLWDDMAEELINVKLESLLSDMEGVMERNLALAANLLTPNRLADIAEMHGILNFKSETHRQYIVDYLRKGP